MRTTGSVRRFVLETRVFIPLVITAIVLPALTLGVYGLWAIDAQQQAAETRVRGAYSSSMRHIAANVLDRVEQLEDALPTQVVLAPEIADPALVPTEEVYTRLLPALRDVARRDGVWREFFLMEARSGTLVTPSAVNGHHGPGALGAGIDRPAGATAAESDAAVVEPIAANADNTGRDGNSVPLPLAADAQPNPIDNPTEWFEAMALPLLQERLQGRTRSETPVPLWLQGEPYLFVCTPVHTLHTDGLAARPILIQRGTLIAWLDLGAFRTRVVDPLLATLQLEEDALSKTIVSAPTHLPDQRDPETMLVAEPENTAELAGWQERFPYWRLAVRVTSVETFRQRETFQMNLYLALIAVLVPLIGVGTLLLGRVIMKEVRTARMKTDFVGRVTHELKTPLTAIRMFIETMQMGHAQTEEERKQCLDVILQESERLTRLIDRVLDFSRMEARNKVYHFAEEDVEKTVRDTIELYRRKIAGTGGVIRLFIEKNLPRMVIDKDAVREVLLNLLDNALKYSPKEKLVAIRVVRERDDRAHDEVHIQVKDQGLGISKEDVSRIFEKFYRVESKDTAGIDGSGLGLTLSLDIAKAHQGRIEVESDPGQGSKFTFVLAQHSLDELQSGLPVPRARLPQTPVSGLASTGVAKKK